MEDLFEMMMQSERLARGRKRAKKSPPEGDQLEGATLREALGGSFLNGGSSPGRDAAWLDVDNALAARSTSYRAEVEEFEEDWEGSSDEAPEDED